MPNQVRRGYDLAEAMPTLALGISVKVADLDAPRVVRGTIDPAWST